MIESYGHGRYARRNESFGHMGGIRHSQGEMGHMGGMQRRRKGKVLTLLIWKNRQQGQEKK